MKIIGLLGSPRKNGNTESLLDVAFEEATKLGAETKKIRLADKTIAPCDACGRCMRTGECGIKDDMRDVYPEVLSADGIIWATPVYYWSMTAQTKLAMDRMYALNFPELQQMNKVGGLITVAGIRGCQNTANIFNMYFDYNHMFATEYASGYAGGKGDILKDPYAVGSTIEMTRQMVSLIQSGIKYPENYPKSAMPANVMMNHFNRK